MKVFSSPQIKEWDQATINSEPISSINLMERASANCAEWILTNTLPYNQLLFFCGWGNNGGDGLAIARMLLKERNNILIYILTAEKRSANCDANLQRLKKMQIPINEIETASNFPEIGENDIVIEALFGTGLNKPLQGIPQLLAEYINQSEAKVISIDMPGGLFTDASSTGNTVIKATHTLSFQCHKLALLMAENADYTGHTHILDLSLDKSYYQNTVTDTYIIDKASVKSFFKTRNQFAHKYSYGHALLFAGSKNMMGAALLSAKSCLRSGAGLVTVHTEEERMAVIQTALPECIASCENNFEEIIKKKAAIGIGPGLERNKTNTNLLKLILTAWHGPIVIDASALVMLTQQIDMLCGRKQYPAILTPHTGEFDKLFGKSNNDFEKMKIALEKAALYNCYIILKGHHSLVACPDGESWFNNTGNSGMATAGSGDVLTGILTGLLCQGYNAKQACVLAVYLHGLAGNFAAAASSEEAMIAGDITEMLGKAFRHLY